MIDPGGEASQTPGRAPLSRLLQRRTVSELAGRGLLSSSMWVLVGGGISRGGTLLASIVVARLILPDEFGRLTLAITSVTLLSGLAGLGLSLAITRQVAETRSARPLLAGRYIGAVVAITGAVALLLAVVILAFRSPIAEFLFKDARFGPLVAAAAVAVLFTAVNGVIQGALTGLEAFRLLAGTQWIQGFGVAAGLIGGAIAGDGTGAMTGFAAGQGVAAGCSLMLLHRQASAQGAAVSYLTRRVEVGELFRFGIPAFVALISVTAALFGAQVLLSRQPSGYSEVALFSVAYRWQLVIMFVPASIAPVLVPVMTRLHTTKQDGELASIFRATMWGTVVLTGVAAVAIAAASPLLFGLSGEFYAEHPLPLIVMAVASIPAALNNVLSSTSISLAAIRAWLVSDLVLAVSLIGAAAALVANLGATGLAVAYLIGMVATDLALAQPLARRLRAATRGVQSPQPRPPGTL